MANLTQLELDNLRHLIGSHQTCANKFETFAQQSNDQQVKQMFQKSAQSARSTAQKLMNFLG